VMGWNEADDDADHNGDYEALLGALLMNYLSVKNKFHRSLG
jgi:hypothetical protein